MAMCAFRFQVWIGFVAITTFVWLLACASEHVRLHMSNLHKWFLADFVFVRLIISVGEQCSLCMCLFRLPDCEIDFSQTSHLNGFAPVWVSWCVLRCTRWLKDLPHFPHLKGLSPLWILEWYIYQVSMCIVISLKWLFAYLTFVSFLLGVGEHVRLQVCIYSKWLITDFTLELLCSSVSELMFLEIWKLVEGLVALCALERLFSTVDLLVLYKVWGICNWFATLATLGTFVRLQDFWSRNLLGTFWEFWSSTKWVFCAESWFWLKMSNLNTSIKWVYCTECWLGWLIGILVHQQNG